MATISASPSSGSIAGPGDQLIVTVTRAAGGTDYTVGTPGAPIFTLTGGTNAAIVRQKVLSTTQVQLTLDLGGAPATLTITDPLNSITTTVTTTWATGDAVLMVGGFPIRLLHNTDGTYSVAVTTPGGAAVTVDQGTDGASAPTPSSAGTGVRGWLSSITKAIQDSWDSTNHLLRVSLAQGLNAIDDSITAVPYAHTATVITTATTTVIKSGAGAIRKIWVPGGTMGNVTVYDNIAASGTVLFPTLTPVAGWVLLEDVAFGTGLTVLTAAATDVVVVWR